jgi:hemoglobin-like flavoprotein
MGFMTPEQAALIRTSFDAIWSNRRAFAEHTYNRFFTLDPDARALFSQDMERQRIKLMDMVAALVGTLDRRDLFQSLIAQSGRQHAGFGVERSQYAAFGEALIASLAQQLGPSFTPELREAWSALYTAVQEEMLRAGTGKPGLPDA